MKMDFKRIEDIAISLEALADICTCMALPIGSQSCDQPTPETLKNAIQGIANRIRDSANQLYTLEVENCVQRQIETGYG